MNRKLLPSLIALMTVGAAGVVNAADNIPTVYGKVNVSLNKNDFESIVSGQSEQTTDNWNMNSNASRLGVKGDLPISDNLKAIYKLEYEIITTADKEGDSGSDFKQRNTYAGLMSKDWGTLIAGRNDSPLKAAQESVDQFNDYYMGDMKNSGMVGENRINNLLMYTTPTMSGFALTVGVAPGEGSGKNTGTTASDKHDKNDNGIADHTSIALTYKLDSLYLAVAHDQNIETTDVTRVVAQYGIGPVKLGALYQTAERTEKYDSIGSVKSDGGFDFIPTNKFKEQDAWLLSAAWDIDSEWTVKGQYVETNSTPTDSGLSDTKAKMYELGVDWKLSKASTVFAYYSAIDTDGDSSISSDSTSDSTVGVGYELKF